MNPVHEEHRKHIALWVAVGGTMAVIVALWVLILPMQLHDTRILGFRGVSRWNTARADEGDPQPTFSAVLGQQRARLLELEKHTGTSSNDAATKIQELRAKIEAASKKNEAAINVNANTAPKP